MASATRTDPGLKPFCCARVQVVKGQFQKVVSGVESTLYSLEAERFELADLNKKLADAQAKSVQQFEVSAALSGAGQKQNRAACTAACR